MSFLNVLVPDRRPTLETERLILRPFRLSDAGDVQRLAGAAEISATTLDIPHPYPRGAAEEWIRSHRPTFEEGLGVHFAITLRETETLVGAIGLLITPRHNRAELGYWIGVPYWNNGYATEAVRAVVAYGFRVLGLHRICANHFPRNPASGRVMQKAGMTLEGTLRQHVKKGTAYEDLVTYGLLRDEFMRLTGEQ